MPQMITREDLTSQTKRAVMQYIHSLDLERDNKLPREEQLCTLIGVSRVTLRSALNELASEGVVFRRQGKGTFVNRTCIGITASFNPATHFSDIIHANGHTPRMQTLSWARTIAPASLAELFDLPEESEFIVSKKLFLSDEEPCVYCEDWFPAAFWDDTPLPTTNISVFTLLFEKTGRKIAWDKVELDVIDGKAKPELQAALGDKPVLLLKSLIYDQDDRPLVLTHEHIDTDKIRLSQIRKRQYPYLP